VHERRAATREIKTLSSGLLHKSSARPATCSTWRAQQVCAVRMSSSPDDGLAHATGLLSSTSDEERFVGLLLAAKLVREPSHLERVFDAAIPFVRRLLHTAPSRAAAGAPAQPTHVYRAVALSLLAAFSVDAQLRVRSELIECLPAAVCALPTLATAAEGADCETFLTALMGQPEALAHALRAGVLPTLTAAGEASHSKASQYTSLNIRLSATSLNQGSQDKALNHVSQSRLAITSLNHVA